MTGMGKHSTSDTGLRRARAAAWTVFLSMCGTTIAFQVYHSVKFGQMPTLLAVLFGVVLLLIAVCVLEFVTEWHGSHWWVRASAYAIMGGSMYMSAGTTGQVVVHAAPPHMSLLFGFLLDGAALLAVHFILSGSPALSRAIAEEDAARRAEMEAGRAAAQSERAARARAEEELLTVRGELAEAVAATGKAEDAIRAADADRAAKEAAEAELDAVRRELAEAVLRAEKATARADRLDRKLGGPKGRSAGGPGSRGTAPKTGPGTGTRTAPEDALEDDLDLEAKALNLLAGDLTMSGAELARLLGVTEGYGRKLRRRLTGQDRPSEAVPDRPQDRDRTAREDRTEDRP